MCARVHELARARALANVHAYAYIHLYTHICPMCVFIFIYKYTYPLISDPNYRVKYRLILKNTHVYVHIQLQHTPGRQESWSSETLIMLSFLERRSKCTVYIFYILIISAITILLYVDLQKLNKSWQWYIAYWTEEPKTLRRGVRGNY